MATVQLRNQTEGRAYYDRRKADGKTWMEAMRALKRRLSNIVYRAMLDDTVTATPKNSRTGSACRSVSGTLRVPIPLRGGRHAAAGIRCRLRDAVAGAE